MKIAAVLVAIILSSAAGIGAGWWHWHNHDAAAAPELICARTTFGVDGTAGPLFCKVADPAVLAYYQRLYPRLFALGPNVAPGQVTDVLKRETQHDLPMDCEAYTLAQTINRWSFGYNPVDFLHPGVAAC